MSIKSHDVIEKKDEDKMLQIKRSSTDSSSNHTNEKNKKGKKQNNQKVASQRYRNNLKEKSKKIEQELTVEEQKQEKLKIIFSELDEALKYLSTSLVNQIKDINTPGLLEMLNKYNLKHTAEKIKDISRVEEPIEVQPQEEIVLFDDNIPVEVIIQTPIQTPIQTLIEKPIVATPTLTSNRAPIQIPSAKTTHLYEDDDCEINRFQELFMHNNLIQENEVQRTNDYINDLIKDNLTLEKPEQFDFSFLEEDNLN